MVVLTPFAGFLDWYLFGGIESELSSQASNSIALLLSGAVAKHVHERVLASEG